MAIIFFLIYAMEMKITNSSNHMIPQLIITFLYTDTLDILLTPPAVQYNVNP